MSNSLGSKLIRLGKVSSVEYETGRVAATYKTLDGNTTVLLPVFSFTDEYKMPQPGEDILILHLSDGQSAGIIMGHYWNKANRCLHPAKGVDRKEWGPRDKYGKCFFDYDDEKCKMTMRIPRELEIIVGECQEHPRESGTITIRAQGQAPSIVMQASGGVINLINDTTHNTGLYTGDQDVVAEGISLEHHTHTGVHGETSEPH